MLSHLKLIIENDSRTAQTCCHIGQIQDTEILVEGHADATGGEEHNRELSIRRANSVSTHLTTHNVAGNRFTVMGYGESQPIADNTTAEGHQTNRRVELAIFANDKLKSFAEKQIDQG